MINGYLPKALLISGLISALSGVSVVQAEQKHVHGEAEMNIAIEGSQITVEFESPADSIVGFEHHPRTAEEHKAVQLAELSLKSHVQLVDFKNMACQLLGSEVMVPWGEDSRENHESHDHHDIHSEDHSSHPEEHHKHEDEHSESEHVEFSSHHRLSCDSSPAIVKVDVVAFKQFLGLRKVTVNWVSAENQGSTPVSKNESSINIKR